MRKHMTKYAGLTLVALVLGANLAACGDDDDSDATPEIGSQAGRASRAGRGGGGAGGDTAAAGKAAGGAGGSSGGSAGKNSESCDGPEGCYSCEPSSTVQYLNRCTESECEPFNNKERLPLLVDGKLPDLP